MIQVQNQALWRAGKAGNELFYERFADAVDVMAVRRMFEARDRRPRCQRGVVVERQAISAKLEHRVVAQAVGIIAIFVAAANLIDALSQQIGMRMRDVAGVSRVDQSIRQSFGQADLTIDTTQQQGTEVGRQTAAVKIGTNGMAGNGWKTELF